jgi:sterol desaturase/sphingolipid hydroxylase (fatty acid hydroxylase superfamily)
MGGGWLGIFIGIITPIYRYIVFEVIYKSTSYISNRPYDKSFDLYNLYKLIRFGNVVSLGLVSYMIVPTYDIEFRYISINDVYICILSFFVTDILFYFSHRTMHNRLVYNMLGHQEHHKLHKPTSYMIIENFTLTDGLSHIIVFYANYMLMRQIFHIDAFLFSLMYSQWVIIGQLQHGGKNIKLDSIPLLEYIRGFFVKDTMCLLHDKHHSLYNKNYSMTGIPDKVFGTISS